MGFPRIISTNVSEGKRLVATIHVYIPSNHRESIIIPARLGFARDYDLFSCWEG